MLWAYIVGSVMYLLTGITIGRASWYVWCRDVKFSKTVKSGDDRWYYYSVQRSCGMNLLFPITSRKKTLGLNDDVVPFITLFLDYMFRQLDENRRVKYFTLLAVIWPIKVMANILIILLRQAEWLLQKMFWLAYGLMCLPFELITKTPKRKLELYRRLWPDANDETREFQETNMFRVAGKTYKRRLQELREERDKSANHTAELDREIESVTQEMNRLQGGAFRTSESIVMPEPAESKRLVS